MPGPDLSGKTVLITGGEFAGEEGICLGPVPDKDGVWAVSPDKSDQVLNLRFEQEFGLLINPGQIPSRN